jgi:hypothetical protein
VSNFLAIATVTEAVRQLLETQVEADFGGVDIEVSMQRPAPPNGGTPGPRINVYLYRVTPNAALRNRDLPHWTSDGREQRQRPVSALDLHYLISFYGNEDTLEPQRLLGSTVRVLRSIPILSPELLDTVKQDTNLNELKTNDLAEQPELVKLTPAQLTLDDLSKLWSVFFQTPYALSVAYEATVVLIEGDEKSVQPLPVKDRNVLVLPFRQPQIESIQVKGAPDAPIVAGSTIVVRGQQLRGDVTNLRVDKEVIALPPDAITDTAIELTLDASLPPEAFRAGVHALQVVQDVLFDVPTDPHRGFASNVVPFILRPTATSPTFDAGNNEVTLNVAPPIRPGQRATLVLNPFSGNPDDVYSFALPEVTADESTPTFPVSGVAAGQYFVRIQVDGAESPVDFDESDPNLIPAVTF